MFYFILYIFYYIRYLYIRYYILIYIYIYYYYYYFCHYYYYIYMYFMYVLPRSLVLTHYKFTFTGAPGFPWAPEALLPSLHLRFKTRWGRRDFNEQIRGRCTDRFIWPAKTSEIGWRITKKWMNMLLFCQPKNELTDSWNGQLYCNRP